MRRKKALLFKAGPGARRELESNGFAANKLGTIAGASGGPKWLVLSQLDRVIAKRIIPELRGPVHLIGSSIGAWRFACYARSAPVQAIESFETAYLNQEYSDAPDRQEITEVTQDVLMKLLGKNGAREITTNPILRYHVMTVRSRHITATDNRALLSFGLMVSAATNIVSRKTLGAFYSRGLFYDPRDLPPFYDVGGFPLQQIRMTEDNLADVVLASGSIPLVLRGVNNIEGARRGTYRDGGIIDYHLDLPLSEPDRLTLYPHFYPYVIPGWFDKSLAWRRAKAENLDRVILLCPSPEFVSKLPNAKIPDRTDFTTMDPKQRRKVWTEVIAACRELADELEDTLDRNDMAERLEPL